MSEIRKNLKACVLVLLAAFLLAAVEWHSDHDTTAQGPCPECCLQCCPSHHLAPTVSVAFSRLAFDSKKQRAPEKVECRFENHPQRIDRPPIA